MRFHRFAALFLLLALAISASSPTASFASVTPTPPKAIVSSLIAQKSELFDLLVYPARVTPKINTTVLAESDGIISKLYAPLGTKVSRHATLLTITHTDPVYQYAPVRMISPVSGVVSSVEVTEGTQVSRGEKLMSVTDPKQLRVNIEVPAQDMNLISAGIEGQFEIAGRDKPVAVKVKGISPFVDPSTGTASCELEILDPTTLSTLAPGLMGRVQFKAGIHSGITIPDNAVVYRGNSTLVRVIENHHIREAQVKLGKRQRGVIELLDGIKEKDVLVVRASRHITAGDEVMLEDEAK